MKKNLFAALGTLILFTIFYTPSVFALGFGVQANYWIPTFNGDLRVDKNGITGTEIDIKNDLGVGNENIPGAEAFFSMGNHEIRLSYSRIDLSGAKTLGKDIVFDGKTYDAAAYVESDLKVNMIDFAYQYKFLNFENILAGFSIGIIGQLKYLDGEARLHSTTMGPTFDNKENLHVPIPMIGLGAKIGILAGILEARAKFAGMGYSGSFFYDALADISLTPFPFLSLHGGYRAMSLKIDNVSDIYAKMDFYGPYAGLAISF
jgi:outer membrane protein